MADTKLSALVELAATPAVDDELYIRDISEAAADESKRITVANLIASVNLVQSKLLSHTRDMTAATGDVGYTGYGFQPTALIIFASGGTTRGLSWGFGDVNLAERCLMHNSGGDTEANTSQIVRILEAGNTPGQTAVLKTLDADGFTLTWTKVGTPDAGNGTIIVLALR